MTSAVLGPETACWLLAASASVPCVPAHPWALADAVAHLAERVDDTGPLGAATRQFRGDKPDGTVRTDDGGIERVRRRLASKASLYHADDRRHHIAHSSRWRTEATWSASLITRTRAGSHPSPRRDLVPRSVTESHSLASAEVGHAEACQPRRFTSRAPTRTPMLVIAHIWCWRSRM
jgi:hypothetical protein